ncbi:MAG: hypothetical protein FWD83_05980 [Promicromonosporaceae bacterium]|nr:hypothetical protein [Promicromonosporaceae bacterium]
MSQIISTNQGAVQSRTGALRGSLRGDRQSVTVFRANSSAPLRTAEGQAFAGADECARLIAEIVLTTTQIAENLQGFINNASARIAQVDAGAVIAASPEGGQ